MKFVFASDSFKGSLSSSRTAQLPKEAAWEVFGYCDTVEIPVADGGEGTVDAVLAARNGRRQYVTVQGPLDADCRRPHGELIFPARR